MLNMKLQAVREWILGQDKLVLVTHQRPDGDAFGSLYGLCCGLRSLGKDVMVYHSTPLPRSWQVFPMEKHSVPRLNDVDFLAYLQDNKAGLVVLDTANWARIDFPKDFNRNDITTPICNIDHHHGNEEYGDLNWIEGGFAAAAMMVSQLLRSMTNFQDANSANFLLAGIATDTGGFRFPNSSAESLEECAGLIKLGGDFSMVMHQLFLQVPYSRRLLEVKLFNSAKFAHDKQLIYAILTQEMFDDLGLKPEDGEGLIDNLKVIEGVKIAVLLQPTADGIRFSLRSQCATKPVDGIANKIGGGGHAMAAGAFGKGMTVQEAIETLINLTAKILK